MYDFIPAWYGASLARFTPSIVIHTHEQVLISSGIWLSTYFRLVSFSSCGSWWSRMANCVRLKLSGKIWGNSGCSTVTRLKANVPSSSGRIRKPSIITESWVIQCYPWAFRYAFKFMCAFSNIPFPFGLNVVVRMWSHLIVLSIRCKILSIDLW